MVFVGRRAWLFCSLLVAFPGTPGRAAPRSPLARPTRLPGAAWWTRGDAACPPGCRLRGRGPQDGYAVCERIATRRSHGRYAIFNRRTRKLVESGEYRDSRYHGRRVKWYESGRRKSVTHYQHGRYHGRHATWYPTGRPQIEQHFRAGLSHGRFRHWHKNGRLAEQGQYRNGQPSGPVHRRFYPSGQKRQEQHLQGSRWHGRWIRWYANGKTKSVAWYHANQRHGTWTTWDPTGVKRSVAHYHQGRPHGVFRTWSPQGRPTGYIVTWRHGRVVRQRRAR